MLIWLLKITCFKKKKVIREVELGSDRLSLFPGSENALPVIFSVALGAATFLGNPDEITIFSRQGDGVCVCVCVHGRASLPCVFLVRS